MTRFAWLQFRTQATRAFAGLLAVAITLAISGPHLVHLYDSTIADCSSHNDCSAVTSSFLKTDGALQVFAEMLLLAVPALIGMFWGAPLIAREFETGTFRLAFTQGVTRTRWVAVKLGVGALASMIAAGFLSLIVTWWFSKIDLVRATPYDSLAFGTRGITPIGYAAFAFTLGATASLLTRRTVPAMLTALIGFVGARLAVTSWVRPHLLAPLHKDIAINAATILNFGQTQTGTAVTAGTRGVLPSQWLYSNQILDAAGHTPTVQFLNNACPLSPHGGATPSCITAIASKFHEVLTYQPASAYWAIQWYETTIFLVLAAVLAGVCLWVMRRTSTRRTHTAVGTRVHNHPSRRNTTERPSVVTAATEDDRQDRERSHR